MTDLENTLIGSEFGRDSGCSSDRGRGLGDRDQAGRPKTVQRKEKSLTKYINLAQVWGPCAVAQALVMLEVF